MIKDTILKFLKLESLIENLTGYVEARVELLKLEIKEDIAKAIANAAVIIILTFAFTLFIVFISIALAIMLGAYVGMTAGFTIVAGIYLLFALILLFFKDEISAKLEHKIMAITKHKKK